MQDLPPPLAAAVVRQSMPTIRKFAQVSMNGPGEQAFGTMQRVVGALGNDADASKLTAQIASAYLPQAERWSGQAFDSIQNAISGGVDPALAKALANGLQQDGKQNQADGINVAAVQGLQRYLAFGKGNPRQAYEDAQTAKQAKDQRLRQLLQNAGPLTATQQANFSKAYMRADAKTLSAFKNHLSGAWWLILYLPSLAAISWAGSTTFGGKGYLSYGVDLVVVGVIGLVFYLWGVKSGWRTPSVEAAELEAQAHPGAPLVPPDELESERMTGH